MKRTLTVFSVIFIVFLIITTSALCETWEVKKTHDNLDNVYDIAQVKNNEGFVFTVEEGFYTIGTLITPNKNVAASMDRQIIKFQIDNYEIERKTPQYRSNGREIDIGLSEKNIKRMAKGQVVKISYYKKTGELIDIKFDLNGSCISLFKIFDSPRFFSCHNE